MREWIDRIKRVTVVRFVLDVFNRFGRDNGGLLAAGLAFFLILAFVPMLLIGIWVLGAFFIQKPHDAMAQIQDLLSTQILPGAAGREVKDLIERANIRDTIAKIEATHGVSGLIGVLGLVWTSMQIYISAASAMNAAWDTTEKRNWLKQRLVALGLLVGTGVLLVLSLAATAYGSYLSRHVNVPFLVTILTEIGAVAVSTVMYTVTYKYLPSARVSWKAAFAGGLIAAVGWEIAKKGLAVYLLHPNTSLYGNLANLIIFILWVYYSMMIFLLGAEASAVYAFTIEAASVAKLKRSPHPGAAVDAEVGSRRTPDQVRVRRGRMSPHG
jgi:membrane protein